MSLFSIKNVVFKNIIHYPDIEIPQNSATFICGESGCGKSTLLKLLNDVISPDSGQIMYNGKSVQDYEPAMLRREVLLCGQSPFLFDGSIEENFNQYYSYRELQPIGEIQSFLKICSIDFPLDANCTSMSGGERQRVFTAICLSLRPKVLMLDEPTSALDDATANAVLTNVKQFCKENGITLIIVSHSQALVQAYADNVITLAGGKQYE